ncbi:hypothetical protein NCS55_00370100 [Fusarium keratoplasticum]|nr:hypothetical protein NCS55_00370100 [Fusarium keratoplasticum]
MSGDVAMQDATPEREQQRVVDIVNNDTDVKESRPHNNLILKASDLTRDEKMHLADLFELFITAHKPLRKQSGETPSYQDFLGEIFASWSSDHKENNPPEIAPPRLKGTSVQAGVLREYDVKLTDEFDDVVDLQVSVMQKYDQDKRERVTKYNRELVVNAARRRICKWAIDGTETTARVDEDDRVSKYEIEDKPILAFGCVRERFEDAEELYTRFKAASS